MTNNCLSSVKIIQDDEYIGESLNTINDNFNFLKNSACDLEEKLNTSINIRTFFYYGPNVPSTPGDNSGLSMDSGQQSYPSLQTIETFVNDANQLNLIPISETGDQVYIIYQKTGWYLQTEQHPRSGSGSVQFSRVETYTVTTTRKIGICFAKGTIIQTPSGDTTIENLQVGDLVYSFDPITKNKVSAKVIKTYKDELKNAKDISPLLHIEHENGCLLITADHWVYMGEEDCLFKAAKELTINDFLTLENGKKSKILSIKENNKHKYVYNIKVEKYHNFIANNVLTGDYQTDDYVALTNKTFSNITDNCVATPNGFIDIQNLKIGDVVYGYYPNTFEFNKQTIKSIEIKEQKCIKLVHEHGEIILPEEKLVLYNGGYKAAKDFTLGEYLTILEDTQLYTPFYSIESKILKIENNIKKVSPVFEITGTQNYIYNKVFVHNGKGGGRRRIGGGRTQTETRTRTVTKWVGYTWATTIEDTYNFYAPIFIIYKLTFNGTAYAVDSGFPKFTRAQSGNTINWKNPQLWSTY